MSQNFDNIPKTWSIARIKDIAIKINSGFPSGKHNKKNIGVPHLRPMNINVNGEIELNDLKYVEASGYEPLIEGDVLFNNTNSPKLLGKTAVITCNTNWAYSNHMTRIRFDTKLVNPKWISVALNTLFFQGFFKMNCTNHVNQASINSTFLSENVLIPLPPINEQKRIVSKLEELFSKLDAGVEYLKKTQILLKQYRQSVLKYAFEGKFTEKWRERNENFSQIDNKFLKEIKEHPSNNELEITTKEKLPQYWRIVKLGDVYHTIMGQSPPGDSYNTEGVGMPLLNGPTEFGKKYPTPIQWTNKITKKSKENDLLICVRGNTTGKMNWSNQEYCIGRGLAAVRPKFPNININLLFFFLQMKLKDIITNTSGSTFPNLTKDKLNEFLFPLIPTNEQIIIVQEIEKQFSIIEDIEKKSKGNIVYSLRLKNSILKQAFEGKLIPQDPGDEPASVLLEKISKEKIDNTNKEKLKYKQTKLV